MKQDEENKKDNQEKAIKTDKQCINKFHSIL